MARRLVPAYVETAGWAVYEGYIYFLDTDDFEPLRDAVTAYATRSFAATRSRTRPTIYSRRS